MDIREDDLSGSEMAALLQEHLADMARHSPPESIHALNLDGLRAAGVRVWSAWDGRSLLGCGALQVLDDRQGEIKSMRTARGHQRKGVAAALLQHIIVEARQRGYVRLYLETGSMAAFAPARALYARFGFRYCGPFGNYQADPNSVFMCLDLTDAGAAAGAADT